MSSLKISFSFHCLCESFRECRKNSDERISLSLCHSINCRPEREATKDTRRCSEIYLNLLQRALLYIYSRTLSDSVVNQKQIVSQFYLCYFSVFSPFSQPHNFFLMVSSSLFFLYVISAAVYFVFFGESDKYIQRDTVIKSEVKVNERKNK